MFITGAIVGGLTGFGITVLVWMAVQDKPVSDSIRKAKRVVVHFWDDVKEVR